MLFLYPHTLHLLVDISMRPRRCECHAARGGKNVALNYQVRFSFFRPPFSICILLESKRSEDQKPEYLMSKSKVIGPPGYLRYTSWPGIIPHYGLKTDAKLFDVLVYQLIDWLFDRHR